MNDLKTNIPGIYKSPISGAVLNKDNDALLAYKKKKIQDKKLASVEEDVKVLKKGISEIKELLLKLIEKKN